MQKQSPASLNGKRCQLILVLLAMIMATLPFLAKAQDYELVVRVGDVLAPSGTQGIPIPIYMENYADTVAGFEVWVMMSHPDRSEFQTFGAPIPDTVMLDTTGTLTSGWEYMQARSLGGGYDADIIGLANMYGPPYGPGIPPQSGDIPLIKAFVDTYEIEDTTTNYTVELIIMADNLDQFGFATPEGELIGLKIDTVVDTSCFNCVQWLPPEDTICLYWEPIPGTSGDSCAIDTFQVAYIDTNVVQIINGSLEVFVCGDLTGDNIVNIFDPIELIKCLYGSGIPGPPHVCPVHVADVNSDGLANIFDITYLIRFLYQGGPDAECRFVWLP